MPTESATVGGLLLPLPAGAISDPTDDPAITLLLAFVGHWLKATLDDRLAIQTPTSADACPDDNRHPWDPLPTGVWTRMSKPALFIFSQGEEKQVELTGIRTYRQRELGLFYVFDELQLPSGIVARAGLMEAAAKTLARAFDRQSHPTFEYGAYAVNSTIGRMLTGDPMDFGADLISTTQGFMAVVPGARSREGFEADGRIERGFPCLNAKLRVMERVNLDQFEDGDEIADFTGTISTNTDTPDPTDVYDILDTSVIY